MGREHAWPDVAVSTLQPLGLALRARGLTRLGQAAVWVNDLPYGRTPDRASWEQVLALGRGTCSTKHALVAAVAAEVSAPVTLHMGIFMMDAEGMPAIWQIGSYKVDYHKAFVARWASAQGRTFEQVWSVRERCIQALSE